MSSAQSRSAGSHAGRVFLGIAVSVLCAYLAMRGVDWHKFEMSLRQVDPMWLTAGMLASALSMVCAGLRWRVAARPTALLNRVEAVEMVLIGSLANLVLSRLGDLARAVLTARRSRAQIGAVLGGMVIERFADVLMLLLLALGLSAFVRFPAVIRAGLTVVAATALAVVGAIWFAAAIGAPLARRVFGVVSPRLASAVAGTVVSLSEGARRSALSGNVFLTLAWSAASWTLSGIGLYCTTRAFALPAPWFAGLFVMVVINLGGVIPSSPGGLGVYHYLVVLALSLWIADPSVPLGFAVVNHALNLIVTAILGCASLFHQGFGWRGLTPSMWTATIAPTES